MIVPDNVLDILLECEESGTPSAALLAYALTIPQPFLTILAACYKVRFQYDEELMHLLAVLPCWNGT